MAELKTRMAETTSEAAVRKAMRSRNPGLVALALLVAAAFSASCSRSEAPKAQAETTPAPAAAGFASPAEAGQALLAAARSSDDAAMSRLVGPRGLALLGFADPAVDKGAREAFASKYAAMNRWVAMSDGSQVLHVGADNYPFPIPIVRDGASRWSFDAAAGDSAVLARRIGRGEILAIDACSAVANAEELYARTGHDGNPPGRYTARILSSAGKQDGLFWEVPAGQVSSPLGRVNDFAAKALAAGSSGDAPIFDGYRFRILTAQGAGAVGGAKSYLVHGNLTGGFAVLASPDKYRETGVMTFLLSREGVVYEQDLGEKTSEAAAAIQAYDPDEGWAPVVE